MITTAPCADSHHRACPGRGLVQGILRPAHEPEARGELVWITVACDCVCHLHQTREHRDLLDEQREHSDERKARDLFEKLTGEHSEDLTAD